MTSKGLWVLLAILFVFSALGRSDKRDYLPLPPGTTLIGKNLSIDRMEVTNYSWILFSYWTSSHYGEKSVEALRILPDTNLWKLEQDSTYHHYSNYYYRHPTHTYHPVTCISKSQIKEYCLFRTSRVLESRILRQRVFADEQERKRFQPFTLEVFLSDSFKYIRDKLDISEIAVYRLPSKDEYSRAISYTDSLSGKIMERTWRRKYDDCKNSYPVINTAGEMGTWFENHDLAMSTGSELCLKNNLNAIHHLRGNVAEWTIHKNAYFGGSWKHSREFALGNHVTVTDQQSMVNVGFRCVATYIEVDAIPAYIEKMEI